MTIYGTLKSFPELRDLESSQRKTVWRACWLCPFLHWQTWAAFLGQFVSILFGVAFGSLIDGWHRIWFSILFGGSVEPGQLERLRLPICTAILFWLGGVVGAFVFMQVYSQMIRPYLKRYLESHDVA
jgi:hypothetical protein